MSVDRAALLDGLRRGPVSDGTNVAPQATLRVGVSSIKLAGNWRFRSCFAGVELVDFLIFEKYN